MASSSPTPGIWWPLLGSLGVHLGIIAGLVAFGALGAAKADQAARPYFAGATFEVAAVEADELAAPEVAGPVEADESRAEPSEPPAKRAAPPALPAEVEPKGGPRMPTAPTSAAPAAAAEPMPEPERRPPNAPPPVAPATERPSAASPAAAPLPAIDHGPLPPALRAAAARAAAAPQYGEEAKARPIVDLAKAFTTALPPAAKVDRAWLDLPFGEAGRVQVRLVLDEHGLLSSVAAEAPGGPPHLQRLLRRLFLLLQRGRFALAEREPEAGTQRIEVEATIVRGEASADVASDPAHIHQIGRPEVPQPDKPGRAYFTYYSGRKVEFRVRLVD